MKNSPKILLPIVIALFLLAPPAQCAPPEDALIDFPQSGMLAAAGNLPRGNLNMPLPIGLAPGVQPPITGSISGGGKSWTAAVTNNTNHTLQIQVEAIEYLQGPRRGNSRPLSFRLKPFQSDNENVSGSSTTIGYILNLTGWKIIDNR